MQGRQNTQNVETWDAAVDGDTGGAIESHGFEIGLRKTSAVSRLAGLALLACFLLPSGNRLAEKAPIYLPTWGVLLGCGVDGDTAGLSLCAHMERGAG